MEPFDVELVGAIGQADSECAVSSMAMRRSCSAGRVAVMGTTLGHRTGGVRRSAPRKCGDRLDLHKSLGAGEPDHAQHRDRRGMRTSHLLGRGKTHLGIGLGVQVHGQFGDLFGTHSGGFQGGEHVAECLCGLLRKFSLDRPFGVGAVLATDVQGATGLGDDSLRKEGEA